MLTCHLGLGTSGRAKMLPKLLISGDWVRTGKQFLACFWSTRALSINGQNYFMGNRVSYKNENVQKIS